MYINYKLAESRGLNKDHVSALIMIRQNKFEDMSEILEKYFGVVSSIIEVLIATELVDAIKGTPKQTFCQKLRVTKKGQTYLDELETPDITEEDIQVFNWAEKVYKAKGKEVGNKKKTKRYIAQFRVQSGIDKNNLGKLLKSFFTDESNMEWNFKLEFAFYKPATMFETRFDLEQSRLFQYYLKNQNYFDKIFQNQSN